MNSDIALVLQGGGTRAAYSAGALDVLLKEKIYFPAVVGTSAGALLGVNYISQDKGRSAALLRDGTSDSKLLSPLNLITKGSIYDFHYLFYVLPNKGLPFNAKKFRENPAKLYAVATSLKEGKTVLFEKSEPHFWEGLAASSSLPLLSKPVWMEEEAYLDGGILSSVPYQEAFSLGFKKVVCVLTREKGYRKKKPSKASKLVANKMYRNFPNLLPLIENSYATYNRKMDELEEMAKENQVFLLYPSSQVRVSPTERNGKKLSPLIELGKKDMENSLSSLKEFIAS